MWVEVLENLFVRCCENDNGKKYRYESKTVSDDGSEEIQILGHDNNSPTQTSTRSPLHKFLKLILTDEVLPKELDATIINIKNTLESNIEKLQKVDNSKQIQKDIDAKYTDLYTDFQAYLEDYDMTPLELIVAVTHCLGVGKPREIVRAFFGYFQTYCGEKGTNVIAIGNASSGKSFILETALSMIPSERVIKGTKTVAYFFNKYNRRDMTGYIFYIGDMGGDMDNQNTIEFRDILKQLTTDGFVERGLMDQNNGEEQEQIVTGFPALSYTTAKEEIVNEQEKTRSVMLSPSPIDTAKLVVFNFLMKNHGKYDDEISRLLTVRDSIQGLVYKFNPNEYDFFNPYMFCIEEHLKGHDDFNRKILEFDAILRIVTLLNNPKSLEHNMYYDEFYEPKKTRLYLASRRDNLNALNIFNSANLLPDESRFANGIIKEYTVFDDTFFESDDKLWEDYVLGELGDAYDKNDGYIAIESDMRNKLFTQKSLKTAHRNKQWFRKSRHYVNERINRLVEEDILANIGKEKGTHHNVYCLNRGMVSSVDSALPVFSKENIDKASNLFRMVYPEQYNDYTWFLDEDKEFDTTDLFEVVKPLVENLPFLEEVFCDL